MSATRVAIIGLGYWGPNLLRNFSRTSGVDVAYACDLRAELREKMAPQYPSVQFTDSYEKVLGDASVDGVIIATPLSTHYTLVKQALEAGKHVLVEKPLAGSTAQAQELVDLAKAKNKVLMVDLTFVYEDAVQKMAAYVKEGAIGKLLYFDSTRINLGIIQKDINVLWDLAVHDLSILGALRPLDDITSIHAVGQKAHTDKEEIAHLHLTFNDGMTAHIHVSWLSPVKIRRTLVGGTDKMIEYDDNEPSEKIRLYDKGVTVTKEEQTFALPVYRSGDILIPRLTPREPLGELARHFAACIRGEEQPMTPGSGSVQIVRILERASESLKTGSAVTL